MTQLELDPKQNFLPPDIKNIHIIGIGGTAMGALAGMLVERGYTVTGSDLAVYPPMSDFLEHLGIKVTPYAPENLDYRPDVVVVGNVVTRQNPESPKLKTMGLPYISFPQALRGFFLNGKKSFVIAGTHGKTTTSALSAWLLDCQGRDPGFMIGGILGNYQRNFNIGRGDWFVLEGDEYDTAFFNKVPKFVHYGPQVGILTSIQYDHADIYPDFEAVKNAFRQYVDLIPADGLLVAWGDDPLVRDMAARSASPVIYYGLAPHNDWRADHIQAAGRCTNFDLLRPGADPLTLCSPLPGEHNVLNTLAVMAALDWIGYRPETLQPGLDGFRGVRRRQEVRGVEDGVTVLDDFAHHPEAVRRTTDAIKRAYPDSRLVAVFEPRTNTSRRKCFQKDYARAFDSADEIVLRKPEGLEKFEPGERICITDLARDLTARGKAAQAFEDVDPILDYLTDTLSPGDVVLIMSNGGFGNIHARLLDALRERAAR